LRDHKSHQNRSQAFFFLSSKAVSFHEDTLLAPNPLPKAAITAHIHPMTNTIQIHLNGEPRDIEAGTTLTSLVNTLGQDPRGVAIERNREIVVKSAWDACVLESGDRLEVVVFVGGG
jgi:sulfur carrier protein